MVIDTSAFLAVFLREPDADALSRAIWRDKTRLISIAAIVETSIVLQQRFGVSQRSEIDALITKIEARISPIDLPQLDWARRAIETYGRGRHSARLNFGDCFSYALAKATNEPLLFKGDDFRKTDIIAAI